MDKETLERANKLDKAITHYKWQLKYIEAFEKSNVKLVVSNRNGGCNEVDIPDEATRQFVLGALCMKYTDLLSKAEKELEEL